MSLFTIFEISSQGMTAQRQRLEAAASNLANAHTTRTAEGGPYRRRDVYFETIAVTRDPLSTAAPFGSIFAESASLLSDPAQRSHEVTGQGVQASLGLAGPDEVVRRFEPGHPDADANGYVSMPDVDPLEETVNMISAARSYEASATAFTTAKELARATLRLAENA
jgi:flagellar basal-body rod protein FlgC